MNIVAIHQPNFFPWLGYFDKIYRSNCFIFLDDVQLPKKGGTWSNRVKLLVSQQAVWVTATLDRNYHGTRTILETCYLEGDPWRVKLLKTIKANYHRHPFYDSVMAVIQPLILDSEDKLSEYNIRAVLAIARRLGLDTDKCVRSSEISHEGSSNRLLASLVNAVGGEVYMCGGGASGYQDQEIFMQNNIKIVYQSFIHPIYTQHSVPMFTPGLSIIDVLMNIGWDGTSRILQLD